MNMRSCFCVTLLSIITYPSAVSTPRELKRVSVLKKKRDPLCTLSPLYPRTVIPEGERGRGSCSSCRSPRSAPVLSYGNSSLLQGAYWCLSRSQGRAKDTGRLLPNCVRLSNSEELQQASKFCPNLA
ncbi:hypothetical protein GGS20DRAFT_347734 [Poronia punctata]|nr:hypothetical protein GGS20DRAFT_347734 [Poronia punctata]